MKDEHIISRTYFASDLENLEENYKGKNVFTLTIDTSNNPVNIDDSTFTLPLDTVDEIDYRMCIEWGDNSVTLIKEKDKIDEEVCSHEYSDAGIYVIKVYSVEDKMPKINFYNNYSSKDFNSYKLVSIDMPLLEMEDVDITAMFRECMQLEDLCPDLLVYNTKIEVVDNLFTDCHSLSKVEEWFEYTPYLESCKETFLNCINIQTIPENLFLYGENIKSFQGCFSGCSSISVIPDTLFSHCLTVDNMAEVFLNCRNITAIPANLFSNEVTINGITTDSCTQITTFNSAFSNTGIDYIPATLFERTTFVSDLGDCFSNCLNLKEIPAALLHNIVKIPNSFDGLKNVSNMFSGCPEIMSIPSNLFTNNDTIEDFSYTFSGCTGINTIPLDLFVNNVEALTFEGTFQSTGISTIPDYLFNATNAINFRNTFSNCSELTNIDFVEDCCIIPDTAEDLTEMFSDCENLVSTTNFRTPENVKIFDRFFSNCSSLETIDDKIVVQAINAESFQEMFAECVSLINLPDNLFANNIKAKSFFRTFYNCMSLKLKANIFGSNTNTRFKGQTINFKECFYLDASVPKEVGTAPALWNFVQNNPVSFDCFGGANSPLNISNYLDIPEIWGRQDVRDEEFKFTIRTISANQDFLIPFTTDSGTLGYKVNIDWGDTNISVINPTDTLTANTWKHKYSIAGDYQISIKSSTLQMPKFSFNTKATSKDLIISVDTPFLGMKETTLDQLFNLCVNLERVCGNLFKNNTITTDINNLFTGCSSLSEVPSDLFARMFYLTNLSSTFKGSGLTSLPNGIFDELYNAENFNSLCLSCLSLVTIPEDLFWENTKAYNFSNMFRNCNKLTMLENIFCSSENKNTRFVGKTVYFARMFEIGTHIEDEQEVTNFIGAMGTAPDLWNYPMNTELSHHENCFLGTDKALNNYNDILISWGGPKQEEN